MERPSLGAWVQSKCDPKEGVEEVEWVKMRTIVRLSKEDFTDRKRERESSWVCSSER
jgi:hypothetical protein